MTELRRLGVYQFGFYHAATRVPDRVALVHNADSYTYSTLLTRVNRLTWALRGMGLGEGDTVAAYLKNGVEYFDLALATGSTRTPAPTCAARRSTTTRAGGSRSKRRSIWRGTSGAMSRHVA